MVILHCFLFHSIILQQYTLTDLSSEIQCKGCRKLIDSENPLFNRFLSYEEMREEEKKNLCAGKKVLKLTIIASVLVENMICSIFLFLFSSPLHSKEPSYKDEYKGWLQPFRLFGPWQNLQVNKLEPEGK